MSNFPTSLDDSASLPNPGTTDKTNSPSHAALHSDTNAAVEAIEAKLGIGATTPAANQFLFGTDTGESTWGTLTSAQVIAGVSDETGTGSLVFGTTPTLNTPKVDTINENTPANGVTIDSLNIKDGKLNTNNSVVTANITDASVTPGKWDNPYCFRAYDSAGTTLTDNTVVTINLGTTEYDYNGNFAANTYTVPFACVFHLDGAFNISGAVSTGVIAFASIYKNGSEAARGQTVVPTGSDTLAVSTELLLAANDTITLRGLQNSAGNEATTTGSAYTYFSGYLVRKV